MKTMIALIALTIVSSTSAMAESKLTCQTEPNKFHGGTSITVTEVDAYDAVIEGSQSGGIAKFIRGIGPVNVKIQHEPDMTIYSNSETGTEFTIGATNVGGRLVQFANFKETSNFPSIPMTCKSN